MELAIFTKILMLAFLGEALTKTLKDLYASVRGTKDKSELAILFVNIIVGVGIAVLFEVDATYVLNDRIDLLGCILTGVIASRGANFVHDLSSKIRNTS